MMKIFLIQDNLGDHYVAAHTPKGAMWYHGVKALKYSTIDEFKKEQLPIVKPVPPSSRIPINDFVEVEAQEAAMAHEGVIYSIVNECHDIDWAEYES